MDDDYNSLGTGLMSGAGTGAAIGGPWGAAIGGAIGLGQSAYGIYQKHKANQLAAENKRPTYEIPDEINQNLSDAQRMAYQGLPESQRQQYLQNITRSQNFGLAGLGDRKAGLSGLGSIVQQGNDASMNLLTADSQARQRNQTNLMNQRQIMAQYKDKAFAYNNADKYQENAAAARGLAGAGLQNVWGGLGTVAGAAERTDFSGIGKKRRAHQQTMSDVAFNPDDYNYGLGEDIQV